jgi:GAF domain-containing protein
MPVGLSRSSESARLRALKALGVLDSPLEEFSQSVVAAAASIVNAPMSAISLIDETRQWFKGSCGLSVDQTDRQVAFCAHTILGRAPLIIEDALLDERFNSNPFVVGEPFVRFYAGFPLVVGGQSIGALCVIDDRPRTLSSSQIVQLSELADGTSAWLSLGHHRRALP